MAQNSNENSDNASQKPPAADTASAAPVKTELELAQEEAAKWKNDFLYLRAEFDNYKKHAIKERSDLVKYGAERLLRDVLEVVDNFDRALQVKISADTMQTYAQGIEMTAKSLKDLLAKHGLVEIQTDLMPFDPNMHEALSSEESASVTPGHILKTYKKAYKLYDKVIRPAQVIVAKAVTQN